MTAESEDGGHHGLSSGYWATKVAVLGGIAAAFASITFPLVYPGRLPAAAATLTNPGQTVPMIVGLVVLVALSEYAVNQVVAHRNSEVR